MIDVLVEASPADAYAQIADLLRDSAQIRLVGHGPDSAVGDEDDLRPDVVVEVFEAMDPAHDLADSFPWNTGNWGAAGVPVILVVANPVQWPSEPLPPGVRAVLPRNVTAAELVGAIEAVAAGLYVFHPSNIDSIAAMRVREAERAELQPEFGEPQPEPLIEPLTPREIEVLQLLSQGLGNKEIASRLNISEHTAKFHVASIMSKLGAATRTEAVTLGIRHGLVMI
jgi:two-component system, NarL family, response regulator YdfI